MQRQSEWAGRVDFISLTGGGDRVDSVSADFIGRRRSHLGLRAQVLIKKSFLFLERRDNSILGIAFRLQPWLLIFD